MSRVAVLFAVLAAVSLSRQAAADELPPPPALTDLRVDEHVGAKIPLDVAVRDSDGRAHRLADYFVDGRPVILVLAYSSCSMLCNLVLRGVATAVRQLEGRPGRDYTLLELSIDPAESPHVAARYQAAMESAAGLAEAGGSWPFLVADKPEIDRLASALGFRYVRDEQSQQLAHPSVIFVLTPEGIISRYLHGVRYPPAELERALGDARAGRTFSGTGIVETVMSCFRFDPARRKYGWLVLRGLQVFAVLMVAGLITAGLVLLRRKQA